MSSSPHLKEPVKKISPDKVKEILYRQGAVLLRHPQNRLEDFLAFSEQIGQNFYEKGHDAHQHREIGGERGRTHVNSHPSLFWVSAKENSHSLPLHGELYFCSSTPPELLWFYCESSAADACPTLICDGVSLFEHLPQAVQNKLIGQKVKYHRYYTRESWQNSFGFEQASSLKHYLENKSYEYEFYPDGSLSTWFSSDILRKQGNTWAFINNILPFGLRELREPGSSKATVRWIDNTPLSQELLLVIEEKALELKQEIVWQQGDILVIDNTRTLHGRGPMNSADRQLYLRMSRADFLSEQLSPRSLSKESG